MGVCGCGKSTVGQRLCEIPMLGEDLDSAENRRARGYNQIVHAVADERGLTVVRLIPECGAQLMATLVEEFVVSSASSARVGGDHPIDSSG
jgi:hypothetical protein